jgi:hypothetical protein
MSLHSESQNLQLDKLYDFVLWNLRPLSCYVYRGWSISYRFQDGIQQELLYF